MGRNLDAARRQLDSLYARRQAWKAALSTSSRRRLAGRGQPLGSGANMCDRAPTQLAAIDRAIAKLSEHLGRLGERQACRDRFFADHAAEREQLDLVRRAETVAELQLRATGSSEAAVALRLPEEGSWTAATSDLGNATHGDLDGAGIERADDWGAEVSLP